MSDANITRVLAGRELGGLGSRLRGPSGAHAARRAIGSWTENDWIHNCSSEYVEFKPVPRSTIAASFSPDGKLLASTHGDHTVKVIDCFSGRCIKVLEGHTRTPWVVRFHPLDSDTLASGSLDHRVVVWRISTGEKLFTHDFGKPIATIAFHPSGKALVVASGHKVVDSKREAGQAGSVAGAAVATEGDAGGVGGGATGSGSPVTGADARGVAVPGAGGGAGGVGLFSSALSDVAMRMLDMAGMRWPGGLHAVARVLLNHRGRGATQGSPGTPGDPGAPSEAQQQQQQQQQQQRTLSGGPGAGGQPLQLGTLSQQLERVSIGGINIPGTGGDAAAGAAVGVGDVGGAPLGVFVPGGGAAAQVVTSTGCCPQLRLGRCIRVVRCHTHAHACAPTHATHQPHVQMAAVAAAAAAAVSAMERMRAGIPVPSFSSAVSASAASASICGSADTVGGPRVDLAMCDPWGMQRIRSTGGSATHSFPLEAQPLGSAYDLSWGWDASTVPGPDPGRGLAGGALLESQLMPVAMTSEQPCVVNLNVWSFDHRRPSAMLDKSRLSVPRAVLCSEMGTHFSPCGRYLALCVAVDELSDAGRAWHEEHIRRCTQRMRVAEAVRDAASARYSTPSTVGAATTSGSCVASSSSSVGWGSAAARTAAASANTAAGTAMFFAASTSSPGAAVDAFASQSHPSGARWAIAAAAAACEPPPPNSSSSGGGGIGIGRGSATPAAAGRGGSGSKAEAAGSLGHVTTSSDGAFRVPVAQAWEVFPHDVQWLEFEAGTPQSCVDAAVRLARESARLDKPLYELRIYSLDGASFGQVLCARLIRAAHCLTSVQFSPTSEHLMVAYGRRYISLCNLVAEGRSLVPAHTIIEVHRVEDLELVRMLPSLDDEVNVAAFHPIPGAGIAYGTKEGRLRRLRYDKRTPRRPAIPLSVTGERMDAELSAAERDDARDESDEEGQR
ncbi:hypothetical protein FOA52_010056 [Chlamydomonas sp. UWO 241]|nr:hypothetical protein FOA52_010056 [Chlamydomonas sp. UWO 241]